MMMEAMTTPGGNDETYGDMDGGVEHPIFTLKKMFIERCSFWSFACML